MEGASQRKIGSLCPPQLLVDVLGPFTENDDNSTMSTYVADVPSQRIQTPISPDDSRPYVTLTFAQSIDAKIAGKGGKQLALSGKESLVMTHWSVVFVLYHIYWY